MPTVNRLRSGCRHGFGRIARQAVLPLAAVLLWHPLATTT